MFGYLPAPCRCQIGCQVDLYRSAFCGLCNALAGQYGQPARLLVNRDSAFVALLAAAQSPEAPPTTLSTRCQPWSRPIPVIESGPIPAFAGAVALCGLQAKLDDEQADERGLRAAGCRALAALSRRRFDRAQSILAASDFPVGDVRAELAAQARVEAHVGNGGDPASAAQPTARAFGSILAHTARLAGNDANAEPLYQVGRTLGELIYTLDAYQDLPADCSRGRFNFLAARCGLCQTNTQEQIRSATREIVSVRQQQLRQAWQEVALVRYRPVLEAVVLTGLNSRTERVLAAGPGRLMIPDDENQQYREDAGGADQSACCGDRWNLCYCVDCDCCNCCDSDRDGSCCDCSNGDCGCCGCGGGDSNCACEGSGCDSCDCGGGDCSGCDCNC